MNPFVCVHVYWNQGIYIEPFGTRKAVFTYKSVFLSSAADKTTVGSGSFAVVS